MMLGILFGGFGGGTTPEVITNSATCTGPSSTPRIPNTPTGQIEGANVEYVDGQLWHCGGSTSDFPTDCYYLDPGASSWIEV